MKKLVLVTIALIVPTSAAMAADAPAREYKHRSDKRPIYKAQPMAYSPSVYDWTGMYVGGHVGWGQVRDVATTQVAGGLLALGAANSITSDQFIGGIQAGYNFKLAPNILLGFEGEFTWLTHGSSVALATLAPPTILTYTASPDWVATAAGRLGYATNKMMIYAKGGAAWIDTSYGSFTIPAAGVPFAASNTRTGYVVGVGLEYAISQTWSMKAEYAYLDFGTAVYNGTAVTTDMQQFKLGLNYHFNNIGDLLRTANPIVTKY